jgi:hypothetical protein
VHRTEAQSPQQLDDLTQCLGRNVTSNSKPHATAKLDLDAAGSLDRRPPQFVRNNLYRRHIATIHSDSARR